MRTSKSTDIMGSETFCAAEELLKFVFHSGFDHEFLTMESASHTDSFIVDWLYKTSVFASNCLPAV